MIDLGISKIALIGAVALIVIGPEKLPRVARMIGTMMGKAQRYIADVKAEVNKSIELDELKKMQASMQDAMPLQQAAMQNPEDALQPQAQDEMLEEEAVLEEESLETEEDVEVTEDL